MATSRLLSKANICRKLSNDNSFISPIVSSFSSRTFTNGISDPEYPPQDEDKRNRTPPDWVSGRTSKFPTDWVFRGMAKISPDWVSGSENLLTDGSEKENSALTTSSGTSDNRSLMTVEPSKTDIVASEIRCHKITKSQIRANNNKLKKIEHIPAKRNKYTIGPERIQRFFDPLYLGYIPKSRKFSTYTREVPGIDIKQLKQFKPSPDYEVFQYTRKPLQQISVSGISKYCTKVTGHDEPRTDAEHNILKSNAHLKNETTSGLAEDSAILNRIARIPKPLEWSYLCTGGEKPLLGMTIGQIIDRASDMFGDREALVSMHQSLRKTFTDLQKDSTEVASGFLSLGLSPGDRLGIWSPNNYEWVVTQFAAAKAGLVLVNINPAYRASELEYCLNKVSVKGIVCADSFKTSNYYNMLCEVVPDLPSSEWGQLSSPRLPELSTVIMIGEKQLPGTVPFNAVSSLGTPETKEKVRQLSNKIQFDYPCNIQFTSGTTGHPKAAVLSHHNMVNNANFVGNRLRYHEKEHRICLPLPLYHCFGGVAGVLCGTLYGAACVLPSSVYSSDSVIKAILQENVTSCYGTPTIFVDLLAGIRRMGVKVPTTLRTGIMSGAPCPPALVKDTITELNMKDFIVMYGMTETSPVTFQCFPDDPPQLRTTTIGFPLPHTEVKITDKDGLITSVGVEGELCVRGYCVFLGYWEDEKKTKECLDNDGWFRTGDLATIDEHGYGCIRGRMKDVVIRGGENIYPAELENLFMMHPRVKEAQVFGVPDTRMGEEVAVWLRLVDDPTSSSPKDELTEESFRAWCSGKMAHYKVPRYVLVKEVFPVTITGKVQKFVMKEQTIKELDIQC